VYKYNARFPQRSSLDHGRAGALPLGKEYMRIHGFEGNGKGKELAVTWERIG